MAFGLNGLGGSFGSLSGFAYLEDRWLFDVIRCWETLQGIPRGSLAEWAMAALGVLCSLPRFGGIGIVGN